MQAFFRFMYVLFAILLTVFIVGGVGIVAAQAFGLATLDAGIVSGAKKSFAPWVYTAATLCALVAFVLRYRPKGALGAQDS